MNTNGRFLAVALGVVILDQLIKLIVRLTISSKLVVIPGILDIVNSRNTGAAFGMLQGQNLILTIISILFIAFVIYYYPKIEKELKIPFALILGGAIGNLLDRLFFQSVIDFFSLSFWPAFNVADSALCIGAVWLIIKIRK